MYDETRCRTACEHIAHAIVRPLIARYYGNATVRVDTKHDGTVATSADVAIEHEIRAFLSETFPDFGVVGEELGGQRTREEYVWTIDPIDGTEAFVEGLPLFGTLLAVVHQTSEGARVPALGAVYLPIQDRLIVGNGRETTIDGCVVLLSALSSARQTRLILGNISTIARVVPERAHAGLMRVAQDFQSSYTWGDCLGYLDMLEGRAHARIEANLGVDDIAPLEPIFLGAGGLATTFDGTSFADALSELPDLADPAASFCSISAVTRELHATLVQSLTDSEAQP